MQAPTLFCSWESDYLDIGLDAGADGGALFTAGKGASSSRIQIGDIVRDEQAFRFAGMDGEFLEFHGIVGRPILWEGELRLSEDAWPVVQTQRAAFRMAVDNDFLLVDDVGSMLANCSLRSFEIGFRRRVEVPGKPLIVWYAPYRIVLQHQEPDSSEYA